MLDSHQDLKQPDCVQALHTSCLREAPAQTPYSLYAFNNPT